MLPLNTVPMVSGNRVLGLRGASVPLSTPDACVISLNSCGFCSLIDWICRQDYRLNHILGVQEHHAANLPRIICRLHGQFLLYATYGKG